MAIKPFDKEGYPDHRFTYNGKELEESTGYLEYGQRDYDPQLGRFHKVDRFAEKYYSMTPYQYGANNPIKYIDVNGDSIYVFDADGNYVLTLDDGESEITGLYFSDQEKDDEGNTVLTNGHAFSFNDIDVDKDAILSGDFKLKVLTDSDIEEYMDFAGVNNPESQSNALDYALNESPSGKSMDFSYHHLFQEVLYIIDGVAYNYRDAGNYLWGYSMKRLGVSYLTTAFGVHGNNLVNSRDDNKDDPNFKWEGFDSKADQRAIYNGYHRGTIAPSVPKKNSNTFHRLANMRKPKRKKSKPPYKLNLLDSKN